jgi:hypothetical protein
MVAHRDLVCRAVCRAAMLALAEAEIEVAGAYACFTRGTSNARLSSRARSAAAATEGAASW